jgi:hypothetical protein
MCGAIYRKARQLHRRYRIMGQTPTLGFGQDCGRHHPAR